MAKKLKRYIWKGKTVNFTKEYLMDLDVDFQKVFNSGIMRLRWKDGIDIFRLVHIDTANECFEFRLLEESKWYDFIFDLFKKKERVRENG